MGGAYVVAAGKDEGFVVHWKQRERRCKEDRDKIAIGSHPSDPLPPARSHFQLDSSQLL